DVLSIPGDHQNRGRQLPWHTDQIWIYGNRRAAVILLPCADPVSLRQNVRNDAYKHSRGGRGDFPDPCAPASPGEDGRVLHSRRSGYARNRLDRVQQKASRVARLSFWDNRRSRFLNIINILLQWGDGEATRPP